MPNSDEMKDKGAQAAQQMKEKAEQARQKAGPMMDQAKEKAGPMMEKGPTLTSGASCAFGDTIALGSITSRSPGPP